ncbi:unnamed protein product, partial [Porites lobata]
KKDKLYKQFINSRDSTTELKYKRYRNKLNHLIKIAKRKYYDTKFEKAKNNLKETWKLINDVINKPSRKAALPNSFFSDGKLLNDPQEIANCFCKFFTNIVWSSTYVTNLNRIFLLQKRAVRIITNADFRAHSEPLFFRLKILDIYNINSFYTAQFMFSYYHQLLPPLFSNLFVTSSNIHNYNTRSSSHFRSHACRTNTKQFSILFQGPKIWNSLPNSVTSIFTLQSFKTKVFDFLLYR